MQTVAGMGNSLFVKKGAGLYYTPTRRKIPINGLVLYLPLWHPGLAGSTIVSKDLNAQSFDVTGAVWGAQGRTFAGAEKILQSVSNWRSADSLGTMIVWFKTSTNDALYMLTSSDTVTDTYYIGFGVIATKLSFNQTSNDALSRVDGGTNVADGSWHMGTVTSDGSTWKIFLDSDNEESLTLIGGTNNGDWFAETANRDNVCIGGLQRTTFVAPYTGVIGDVLVYNRVLSTTEIKNIYQATKWRYT